MKKNYLLFAALAAAFLLAAGCIVFQNRRHEEREDKKPLRVGVTLYRGGRIPLSTISAERWRRRRRAMRRRRESR